jgi:biotin transport system substrate-specific component
MLGKLTTKQIVFCGLFTALAAVGAFIKIPLPPIPFTMQTLFVVLSGLLLGSRLGAISIGVYVALGLIGVPVFTQGGGLGYLLKPTFGYLIGFILDSWIAGRIAEAVPNPSFKRMLAGAFAGLAVVYLCGMVYVYILCNCIIDKPMGFRTLVIYCFLIFVPSDSVWNVIASLIAKRLRGTLNLYGKQA